MAPLGSGFYPLGGLLYQQPLPPPVEWLRSPFGRGRMRWSVPVWATTDEAVVNVRGRFPREPRSHIFKE